MLKPRLASLDFVIAILLATAAKAATCNVAHVYDGDTLLAVRQGCNIKVCLAGIDAPETGNGQRQPGQPYRPQAKAFLAKHVQNEAVQLTSCGDGRSNRVLSEVFVKGPNINLKRVKAGRAEACRGKTTERLQSRTVLSSRSERTEKQTGHGVKNRHHPNHGAIFTTRNALEIAN